MKTFVKWLSLKDWAYKFAVKILANRIVYGKNQLTEEYLLSKGFVRDQGYWIEPTAKLTCRIWIELGDYYYRIWYGKERTFISLESSLEWFENFYLISHKDNGIYKLAGF